MGRRVGHASWLIGTAAVAGLLMGKPTAAPSPSEAGGILTGIVVSSETGMPLPGAHVDLFLHRDPETARQHRLEGERLAEPVARATADGAGRFRLTTPPNVRVFVVAEAPGRARMRTPRTFLPPAGDHEQDLGRIELPPGRRLAGKVLDASGRAVAGATVIGMLPPARGPRGAGGGFARRLGGGNEPRPFPVAARTAEDGSFTLDSLPRRPVTVRAWADGMAPGRVEDVGAPGAAGGLVLRLAPGVSVEGRVLAPDGTSPVAEAWVMAGDEGLDGITRSSRDGSFRLENVRPGPASLVAAASAPSGGARATWAPSAPLRVSVPLDGSGPGPTLRLRPGGVVKVRAQDAETRQPLEGALLWLDAPGEILPRMATTGRAGEALFLGVPVGSFGARAEADGYLEESLRPTLLASGQRREWSAPLRAAAAVGGAVRDAAGRPIVGARVSVSGPPPFPLPVRIPLFLPIGVDSVRSDASGRFLLERLPPRDELKLSVEAEGYAPWSMSGVRLKPGEKRGGMEVLLESGGVLSGRLLDRDGRPVAFAEVTASRRRDEGSGGVVIRLEAGGRGGPRPGRGSPAAMASEDLPPVSSGADGVFRIRGTRPGIWSVDIQAEGFAPRSLGGLSLEGSGAALDAGDIVLEPGARLAGRLLAASGEPVAFARGTIRKDLAVLCEFESSADGAFETPDLVPGELVTLGIDADGYGALERSGLTPPMTGLVITLSPAAHVSGQVLDKESHQPIVDFSLAVSRSRSAGGAGMMMTSALSGPETSIHSEDGTFTLENVDPGKVAITARAPGYREAQIRELDVPEGQDLAGVDFMLDRAASVSGVVVDDGGRPLFGVVVQKKEASGGAGMVFRAATGGGRAATDGDGNFALDGLERGALTLSFTHAEFEPEEESVDTTRDVTGLRVTLSRGATLTGVVRHDEDGSPVSGANVSATAAGSDRFGDALSVATGPDGSFALPGVPAGRYMLRAESGGLRAAVLSDVVVTAGASPPPFELRLSGGVTLTGTLAGLRNADLSQFNVRAVGGMGGFGAAAPVDAAGRFEMKGLAPGTVTLIASSGLFGGRSATRTLRIPDGVATFETTIEFPKGHRVEGTITRGGRPLDGATVIFTNSASRTGATATSSAAGAYAVDDLEDGEHDIAVLRFSSGVSWSTKEIITADRRLDLRVPAIRLTGFVTDAATGDPLEGASVSVHEEGGAATAAGPGIFLQQQARSDATGYFAIEGLGAGTYSLTARRDGYGFDTRMVAVLPDREPDGVLFELSRTDAFTFHAIDAASGTPLRALTALVLAGGGDPLAPGGSGAIVAFQGRLSADTEGRFRIDTLQPGVYRLVLGGQGVATLTVNGITVPAGEQTLLVPAGGGLEITAPGLTAGQTARAVLLDAEGRPVHVNTFLPEPAFTLRAGAPTVLADIAPGRYRLRALLPGGIAEAAVTVAPGQEPRVTVP